MPGYLYNYPGGGIDPEDPSLNPDARSALQGAHLAANNPGLNLAQLMFIIHGGRQSVQQRAPRSFNVIDQWQKQLAGQPAQQQQTPPLSQDMMNAIQQRGIDSPPLQSEFPSLDAFEKMNKQSIQNLPSNPMGAQNSMPYGMLQQQGSPSGLGWLSRLFGQ